MERLNSLVTVCQDRATCHIFGEKGTYTDKQQYDDVLDILDIVARNKGYGVEHYEETKQYQTIRELNVNMSKSLGEVIESLPLGGLLHTIAKTGINVIIGYDDWNTNKHYMKIMSPSGDIPMTRTWERNTDKLDF